MINRFRKSRFVAALGIGLLAFVLLASAVNAGGINVGLEYPQGIGLGTADLRSTIALIINIALGFLGTLAVAIVLYGGFLYMTSGGSVDRVDKARKTLVAGAIGIGIILTAYAITAFVFGVLLGGTGVIQGPGFGGNGGGGGGGDDEDPVVEEILAGCPDPDPSDPSPFICELDKTTDGRGAVLNIRGGKFGEAPGEVWFAKRDYIEEPDGSTYMESDEVIIGPVISESGEEVNGLLTPEECDVSDECYRAEVVTTPECRTWFSYQIKVIVPEDIVDLGDYYVVVKTLDEDSGVGLVSAGKDTREKTSLGSINVELPRNDLFTLDDIAIGPGLYCIIPEQGKEGDPVRLIGTRFGDTPVGDIPGAVTFFDGVDATDTGGWTEGGWTEDEILTSVPAGAQTGNVVVTAAAQTGEVVPRSNYSVFAVSCDLSGECASGCCYSNMCTASARCLLPINSECTLDSQCASGYCNPVTKKCDTRNDPEAGEACGTLSSNGLQCTDVVNCSTGNICNLESGDTTFCTCIPHPTILEVLPRDGAVGTYMTIFGLNFDNYTECSDRSDPEDCSHVTFKNSAGSEFYAYPPAACANPEGNWTSQQIVVEVPEGVPAGNYDIVVTRGDDKFDDTTDDAELFFTVNDKNRPNLCYVYKEGTVIDIATLGESVTFLGEKFEQTGAETNVYFSGTLLEGGVVDSNQVSGAIIPNLEPNTLIAQVQVGDTFSNPKYFTVDPPPDIPRINYLDSTSGPKGQYVSIFGSNFGDQPGTLTFDPDTGDTIEGSGAGLLFAFPDHCSLENVWTDNNIIFTVPDHASIDVTGINGNDAVISVTNSRGLKNPVSDNQTFTVCDPAGADCELRPGICGIEPNQGPSGTPGVRILGAGFGEISDQEELANSGIAFFQNAFADIPLLANIAGLWTDTIIGELASNGDEFVVVPPDAQSGPVYVQRFLGFETDQDGNFVLDGSGNKIPITINSSSINFNVEDCRVNENICGEVSPVCCQFTGQCVEDTSVCKPLQPQLSKLAYEFITGEARPRPGVPHVKQSRDCTNDIQSPSPFIDSVGNCKNAVIAAKFTDISGAEVPMEFANFSNSTIRLFECQTTPGEDDEFTYPGPESFTLPIIEGCTRKISGNFEPIDGAGVGVTVGFEFTPDTGIGDNDTDLELNTWYLVQLISGPSAIRSQSGFWLDGDSDGIPEQDDHYQWAFKTGNDPNVCTVDRVEVLPDESLLTSVGEQQNYTAMTMARNCNILDANAYDWSWTSRALAGGSGDNIASISNTVLTGPILDAEGQEMVDDDNNTIMHDDRVEPRQTATALDQGAVFIGAQPIDPATDTNLVVNDLENRLIVDLNIPEIDEITPQDGFIHPAVNAYVTIRGRNFGETQGNGRVYFGAARADIAQCANTWNDTEIKVNVPKPLDIQPSGAGVILDTATRQNNFSSSSELFTGLVQYNFNEDSTALARDLGGTFDGVLINVEKENGGAQGRFLALDQSTANSYLQSQINEVSETEGSFELWFNPENLDSDQTLMQVHSAADETEAIIIRVLTDGSLTVTGSGYAVSTINSVVSAGNWHHLIVRMAEDGTDLYLNGKKMRLSGDVGEHVFLGDLGGDTILYLGGLAAYFVDISTGELTLDMTENFNGGIDNFGIYQKPLSVAQVEKNYGLNPLISGAVAAYRFDGTGVEESDASPNRVPISTQDFPERVEQGYFNKSLRFDPAALGGPQSLMVGPHDALTFNRGISVVAWVKPATLSGVQKIVSADMNGGFSLGLNDTECGGGQICFKVYAEGQATPIYAAVDAAESGFVVGEWNLLVGTYDNHNIRLYVNGGVLDDETNTISPNREYPGGDGFDNAPIEYSRADIPVCLAASIGGDVGSYNCAGAQYDGELDTTAIYNKALRSSEIARLFGVINASLIRVETSGGTTKTTNTDGTTRDELRFNKSENIYPFLCSMRPNFGPENITLNLTGDNFGDQHERQLGDDTFGVGSFIIYDEGGNITPLPKPRVRGWGNNQIQISNPIGDTFDAVIPFWVRINPLSEPFNDNLTQNGLWDSGEDYFDINEDGVYDQFDYEIPVSDGSVISTTVVDYLDGNSQDFYGPPVITGLSPDNGPMEQWVTIKGYNFGEVPGRVFFTSTLGGFVEATLALCNNNWNNNEIIVEVPDEAVTGGPATSGIVYIQKPLPPEGGSGFIDSNKNQRFEVNDNPLGAGLCSISPNQISRGQAVNLSGVRFEDVQGESEVNINNQNLGAVTAWSNLAIDVDTDINISSGDVRVLKEVQIGETCPGFQIGGFCPGGRVPQFGFVPSNGLNLDVLIPSDDATTGGYDCVENMDCNACGTGLSSCVNGACTPVITNITPPSSAIGGYVSIHGCYFGDGTSPGTVHFTNRDNDMLAEAVTPDQNICGNTWTNNLVVIEVPLDDELSDAGITDPANPLFLTDAYDGPVKLTRGDDGYSDDTSEDTPGEPGFTLGPAFDFNVDNSIVQPYVCSLTPNEGDPLSQTSVNGKGFGDIRSTIAEGQASSASSGTAGNLTIIARQLGDEMDDYTMRLISTDFGDNIEPYCATDDGLTLNIKPGLVTWDDIVNELNAAGLTDFTFTTSNGSDAFTADDQQVLITSGGDADNTATADSVPEGDLVVEALSNGDQFNDFFNDFRIVLRASGVTDAGVVCGNEAVSVVEAEAITATWDNIVEAINSDSQTNAIISASTEKGSVPFISADQETLIMDGGQGAGGDFVRFKGNFGTTVDDQIATQYIACSEIQERAAFANASNRADLLVFADTPGEEANGYPITIDVVAGAVALAVNVLADDNEMRINIFHESVGSVTWNDIATAINEASYDGPSLSASSDNASEFFEVADAQRLVLSGGISAGSGESWSNNRICLLVPEEANTGAVEVTNDGRESDNRVPFRVYEVTPGPELSFSNPGAQDDSVCTNTVVEVGFSKPLDVSTVASNVRLVACENVLPVAKNGLWNRFANFVRELFARGGNAQVTDEAIDCNELTDVSITTRTQNGGTVVRLTPQRLLSPRTLYRVNIGSGITDMEGVVINTNLSEGGTVTDLPSRRVRLTADALVDPEPIDWPVMTIQVNSNSASANDILRADNGERLLVQSVSNVDANNDELTVLREYYGSNAVEMQSGDIFLTEDDFTFATKGTRGELNSGVCQFDDVRVTVYNSSGGSGQLAENDFFVCTGENCRLDFDYDQAPGPLNTAPNYPDNQHRYIAIATSEINSSTSFEDRFERTVLSVGNNSYVDSDDCASDFQLVGNNHIEHVGVSSCDDSFVIAESGSTEDERIFPQATPFTFRGQVLNSNVGYGFIVGGNKVFREATAAGFRYVIESKNGLKRSESDDVIALPNVSNWEISWLDGIMTLTVNGNQVLPRTGVGQTAITFRSDGRFGLYYGPNANAAASWDNIFLNLESFNVLKGIYTWSRSDRTDPLRLVTLLPDLIDTTEIPPLETPSATLDDLIAQNPNLYPDPGAIPQDFLVPDANKIQNNEGETFVQVEPVATGQTKIVIEATTDVGADSNTVSKEFPINIFICENPWPSYDQRFTDNAYNFLTFYCRDVGDATDPSDNLPPATILERCEYREGDSDHNTTTCEGNRVCAENNICVEP